MESYKHISAEKKEVDQGRDTTEYDQMSNEAKCNTDIHIKTRGIS